MIVIGRQGNSKNGVRLKTTQTILFHLRRNLGQYDKAVKNLHQCHRRTLCVIIMPAPITAAILTSVGWLHEDTDHPSDHMVLQQAGTALPIGKRLGVMKHHYGMCGINHFMKNGATGRRRPRALGVVCTIPGR
jgi:hypothetical protein